MKTRATVVLALIALGSAYAGRTTLKRLAYEEPGRDRWQRPAVVVQELGIEPGQVIADLGSGGGYFSFRLARAVGEQGKVYAVEVDLGLQRYVERRAAELGLSQLEVVAAAPDDPRLPEPVDLLFSCNTVHHLSDVAAYFRKVHRSLRSGGRVVLIDYRDKHRSLPEKELIQAMAAAGFELAGAPELLQRQYFLIFRAAPSGAGEGSADELSG